ncbi:hypothetical protein EXU57_20625 [Segetibacter sp. 3557_3]|uniref:DUF6814 family protein n=1 Tax=Segetibacter sp. 3557_3 TaxID=2547429 RepID=UPI001058808B|nr:hypothetical protein [Segetibacter sp. 3557_3]TDH20803.1 hypothetical protein EXU57_20625 [Segetibacter sp. 3557_3]
MNNLKRGLGIIWMILGPASIIFMIWQAADKIGIAREQVQLATSAAAKSMAASNATNTILQWAIIIAVFLPIATGLVIFGKYAMAGEYDRLPESSQEL